MSKHTSEPWILVEGGACEKEMLITTEDRHETCVIPIAEMDVIFDGEFGDEQSANARRIVACVNACEGIDTETLELFDGAARQAVSDLAGDVSVVHEARKRRDELLSALELMVLIHDEPSGFEGKFGKELDDAISAQKEKIDARLMVARAAIAKVKGGAS